MTLRIDMSATVGAVREVPNSAAVSASTTHGNVLGLAAASASAVTAVTALLGPVRTDTVEIEVHSADRGEAAGREEATRAIQAGMDGLDATDDALAAAQAAMERARDLVANQRPAPVDPILARSLAITIDDIALERGAFDAIRARLERLQEAGLAVPFVGTAPASGFDRLDMAHRILELARTQMERNTDVAHAAQANMLQPSIMKLLP